MVVKAKEKRRTVLRKLQYLLLAGLLVFVTLECKPAYAQCLVTGEN